MTGDDKKIFQKARLACIYPGLVFPILDQISLEQEIEGMPQIWRLCFYIPKGFFPPCYPPFLSLGPFFFCLPKIYCLIEAELVATVIFSPKVR